MGTRGGVLLNLSSCKDIATRIPVWHAINFVICRLTHMLLSPRFSCSRPSEKRCIFGLLVPQSCDLFTCAYVHNMYLHLHTLVDMCVCACVCLVGDPIGTSGNIHAGNLTHAEPKGQWPHPLREAGITNDDSTPMSYLYPNPHRSVHNIIALMCIPVSTTVRRAEKLLHSYMYAHT